MDRCTITKRKMRRSEYTFLRWLLTACFLIESFSETKDIRLPALGRRAEFFEVYNLMEDELTRVVAIPMQNEKDYKVKTVPLYERDYEMMVAATMAEFINSWKFGITVKMATVLSVFKGFEAGFEIKKHWENSVMTLVLVASIKAKTIREEVDPCNKTIWHGPNHQPERNKAVFAAARVVGDHVLVAKEYGFEVDIYVKLISKSSEESLNVEANLELSMELLIKKITFEIDTESQASGGDHKIEKDAYVTVTVSTRYATFPFAVPTDYKDIPKFVKQISAYLNDHKNSNGSVVEYILKPSHEIEMCTKVGTVIPKNYSDLDRISERMLTFFLEIDRQETENYRFQSRFDLVKDCLNTTEYATVVRQIMDTRMILMDMRIQVIEAIETYRRKEDSYEKVIAVLTSLTRETLSKTFSVKKFLPEELLHKVNFMFALANDRKVYCFPRYMNPSLHYDSYIQDNTTLAFLVFRSADFISGELVLKKYVDLCAEIGFHQLPWSEQEQKRSKQIYLRLNERTGRFEDLLVKPVRDRKRFIALNCDVNFAVCELMPQLGLYHGWTYERLKIEKVDDFWIMHHVYFNSFSYIADRCIMTPNRIRQKNELEQLA